MEWELYKHLKEDHREAFADIFNDWAACAVNDKKRKKTLEDTWEEDAFMRVISDYMAAVCEKERETMPTIGIAKDRQVLRSLHAVLQGISSRICFGCAQIYACVPLWSEQYGASTMQTGTHIDPDTGDVWSEHPHRLFSFSEIDAHAISRSVLYKDIIIGTSGDFPYISVMMNSSVATPVKDQKAIHFVTQNCCETWRKSGCAPFTLKTVIVATSYVVQKTSDNAPNVNG